MVKKVSEILVFRKPKVSDQTAIRKIEEQLASSHGGISGEVTSEDIKDETIQEVDLNPEVAAGLHELEDEDNYATDDMVAGLFNK